VSDYINFQGTKFKIPDIAAGKVVPPIVDRLVRAEEEKRRAEKRARLYFWAGIICSVLCMFGGYLLGKFC
jgi:hypothetical protein